MRFSRVVVLLVYLSQVVSISANAIDSATIKKIQAEHCAKFPKESFCSDFAPTKPQIDEQAKINKEEQAKADEAAEKAELAKAAKKKADAELSAKKAELAKQQEKQAKEKADLEKALQAQKDAAAKAELEAELQVQIEAKKKTDAELKAKIELQKIAEAEAKKKQKESETLVNKTDDGKKIDTVTVTTSTDYTGPARATISSEADNNRLFSQYCQWNGDVNVSPVPKYDNSLVVKAAKILTNVSKLNAKNKTNDFYFYPELRKFYKAGSESGPAEYSREAKIYLTQVCGEFRDRAEMIEAKIKWVTNMFIPGGEVQKSGELFDYSKNVWSQLSGSSYNPYIKFTDALFGARAERAEEMKYLVAELGKDAEYGVAPNTICETKYIIGKYVAENKSFSNLKSYEAGLAEFEKNSKYCSQEDKDYFYNFRGDANFKEYSPESNAMIWHARSIGQFCKSGTEASGNDSDITAEDCSDYLKKPFLTRYNAARSGLAAWLLYSKKEESKFANQENITVVFPKFDKNVGKKAFEMKLTDGTVIDSNINLVDSTLGFNHMFGIGAPGTDRSGAFDRLKNAVNRHTNWYKSGYHNMAETVTKEDKKDQAYSPFVASSYEMSKSNQFAECGYTVQCPKTGRKAWMFIFRLHKSQWYHTQSLVENKTLNFDNIWLDETTFGTDRLADHERALDRLGTSLEKEFDSIIYLHNLSVGGFGTQEIDGAKPISSETIND